MLGLHQFFLSLPHRPIPVFVVDHPSQVYFPKNLVDRGGDAEDDEPQLSRDEDVEAVRKAFDVIGKVVTASKGKLQPIVLDHAPRRI